ncbi:PadR family transcriptional regulator [Actinoallomurus sp. NPDC050550]|uniref:PadR family transcriptional regulator n=1 Tax=Actinoallomurus sp. NPDC050550 TaxID=3154937 RepID=UPI0033BFC7CC
MTDVRVTVAVAQVLSEFLTDPSEPRYGYDLMRQTGFPSGKLYPILARLERAGWLSRTVDPGPGDGPPRRLYRLTPNGAESARQELALLHQQLNRSPRPFGQPQPEGDPA